MYLECMTVFLRVGHLRMCQRGKLIICTNLDIASVKLYQNEDREFNFPNAVMFEFRFSRVINLARKLNIGIVSPKYLSRDYKHGIGQISIFLIPHTLDVQNNT